MSVHINENSTIIQQKPADWRTRSKSRFYRTRLTSCSPSTSGLSPLGIRLLYQVSQTSGTANSIVLAYFAIQKCHVSRIWLVIFYSMDCFVRRGGGWGWGWGVLSEYFIHRLPESQPSFCLNITCFLSLPENGLVRLSAISRNSVIFEFRLIFAS